MKERLNKDGIRYLLVPFRWTILMMLAFFIAAGRFDIPRAWLAFGLHLVGAAVGGLIMIRFSPGLANERATVKKGTKFWDKVILTLYFLTLLLLIPVTAGLDVGRYLWSGLSASFAVLGVVCYLAFFLFLYWAMLNNIHFEGSSRIQTDRGHKVVMVGPYAFVRHPGYVAMIFASLTDALVIGSLYALIPSCFAVAVTVVRTVLEDRMLRRELDGYADYARKVKYRLIPGVW